MPDTKANRRFKYTHERLMILKYCPKCPWHDDTGGRIFCMFGSCVKGRLPIK